MRDDEGPETVPGLEIIWIKTHGIPPVELRRWKGFGMGTARSGAGGPNAGPGGTKGTWTCVAASYNSQVKGLACAPNGTPKYSRLKTCSPNPSRSFSRNAGS